jgi:SAM-dependent methyltransferase
LTGDAAGKRRPSGYRGSLGRAARRYLRDCWDYAESDYRDQMLVIASELRPHSLLDLGCADGEWTQRLAQAAELPMDRVSGLEITDDRLIAQARGMTVEIGDLNSRLHFDDASFELVHANQVIEHVVDLDTFVSEMFRVTAVGGHAIVCTENLASWHNVAALTVGFMPFSLTNISNRGIIGNPFGLQEVDAGDLRTSYFHTRVLTLTGLSDIFRLHGFAIRRVFGSGFYPAPPVLARRASGRFTRHAAFIGLVAERPHT